MEKTHYSAKRFENDDNKMFMNDSVISLYKHFVENKINCKKKVVVLLDDSFFQSTMKCDELHGCSNLHILIAQNNEKEYLKMKENITKISNIVKRIRFGDYGDLKPHYRSGERVVIDQADFCKSWKSVKHVMLKRLQDPHFYAERAIVRLTVSCRCGKLTVSEYTDQVLNDYVRDAPIDTAYCVKPLSIRQWMSPGSNGIEITDNDVQLCKQNGFKNAYDQALSSEYYKYGQMINFIFLIIRM